MRRLALLLPLLLVAMTACTGDKKPDAIAPPVTLEPIVNTTLPDFSGVELNGVPGKTTTTMGIGPGRATLKGTVEGPDGPVGGATIRVERLVADVVAAKDFSSNADGTFVIPQILGGRYRVRAYVPDPYNLAQVSPVLLFLGGTDTQDLKLQMGAFVGLSVKSSIAPRPPLVDEPANLVVQVTNQSVDNNGIVRGEGISAVKVELFGSSAWRVQTANPTVTDARGNATFRITCGDPGAQPLSATVNDTESRVLEIPECAVRPPTTTTEAPAPAPDATTPQAPGTTGTTRPATTTTAGPGTTSTTRPPTTTTTTRPPTTTTTTRRP